MGGTPTDIYNSISQSTEYTKKPPCRYIGTGKAVFIVTVALPVKKRCSLNCAVCGRVFMADRPEALYCNDWCRLKAYKQRRDQRNQIARQKVCLTCKGPFIAKRKDGKYCCPACKQEAYRNRLKVNDKRTLTAFE